MDAEKKPKSPDPPRQLSAKGLLPGAIVFVLVAVPLWYVIALGHGLASQQMSSGAYVVIALVAVVPAAIVWAIVHFPERPPE